MFKIKNNHIIDSSNRILTLRGVNLGGSSKVPASPFPATHKNESLTMQNNLSFVNRPFPIHEAREHFSRLKSWGLTFIRFLVNWEAIEHTGPGVYDIEYLDYVQKLLTIAAEYDLLILIDFHQDAWSRYCGGEGMPFWTFDIIGMNPMNFNQCSAAITHNIYGLNYPNMLWPTNLSKLACATMFTIFFGGNDFAPNLKYKNIPIQEFLQNHYINAAIQLAQKLKGLPNIIGYEVINEPSKGYIGYKNLNVFEDILTLEECPTPFQSFLLGSGIPTDIDIFKPGLLSFKKVATKKANPDCLSIWKNGYECIWKKHGLWAMDRNNKPILLKPDYFAPKNGDSIDFNNQYLKPFINKFGNKIRAVHENSLIFIEDIISEPPFQWTKNDIPNVVYSPHWYDGFTVFKKRFYSNFNVDVDNRKILIGKKVIHKNFTGQISRLKERNQGIENCPVLIGEFGIPFNMNNKKSYRTGNFIKQTKAIDNYMNVFEHTLSNWTIWNYTSDNSNEFGDHWNNEDFSIYSNDQQSNTMDVNSGGRVNDSIIRPYAYKTAGIPLAISFNYTKKIFKFKFRHLDNIEDPTEIFIPSYHYPANCKIIVSDGKYFLDLHNQKLKYYHSSHPDIHTITIFL